MEKFQMINELPIHSFLMIHPSGLIIYNKSFVKESVDENLFSGFVAAILAFSKELGSELSSIGLHDKLYYFYRLYSVIVVLGLAVDSNQKVIEEFFSSLNNSSHFVEITKSMESRIIFPLRKKEVSEVDELLNPIFARYNSSLGEIIPAEELTFIKDIIEELQKDKIAPRTIAERIFGEGFTAKDPEYIQEKIDILKTFISSNLVHESFKRSLSQLIQFLERTIKSAKIFGF
jgi:hypothetical protein